MSHIQYTIKRSGTYFYNRRVPTHAVESYGTSVRQLLSKDPEEALAYSNRLTEVLDASWKSKVITRRIDVAAIVSSFKPKTSTLSEIAEEYLGLRPIDQTPPRVALESFLSIAGDRDVETYTREDAKLFVAHLFERGNKTATIKRRVGSLSAILNYAYSELDVDKRNPFGRLFIKGQGEDVTKRGTFSVDQLKQGYSKALASGSQVKLLMPLLGETGCRLAEIVGLRIDDIDLDNDLIYIRPNQARRLKTKGSERVLPLVGQAKEAMIAVMVGSDGEYLYPQYIKDSQCYATHASNALNKWIKKDFDGLTAHSLRHTFRDRLRDVECPMDAIDQLGGWRTVGSVGNGYGHGYSVGKLRGWVNAIAIR